MLNHSDPATINILADRITLNIIKVYFFEFVLFTVIGSPVEGIGFSTGETTGDVGFGPYKMSILATLPVFR